MQNITSRLDIGLLNKDAEYIMVSSCDPNSEERPMNVEKTEIYLCKYCTLRFSGCHDPSKYKICGGDEFVSQQEVAIDGHPKKRKMNDNSEESHQLDVKENEESCEDVTCFACLGILQPRFMIETLKKVCDVNLLEENSVIVKELRDADNLSPLTFTVNLSFPLNIPIREHLVKIVMSKSSNHEIVIRRWNDTRLSVKQENAAPFGDSMTTSIKLAWKFIFSSFLESYITSATGLTSRFVSGVSSTPLRSEKGNVICESEMYRLIFNIQLSNGTKESMEADSVTQMSSEFKNKSRSSHKKKTPFWKMKNLPTAKSQVNRQVIDSILKSVSDEKFLSRYNIQNLGQEDNSGIEKSAHTSVYTSSCKCVHKSIFIGGRYLKYSRRLSQTPWTVFDERSGKYEKKTNLDLNVENCNNKNGSDVSVDSKLESTPVVDDNNDIQDEICSDYRIHDTSVEELICQPLCQYFGTSTVKFTAAGREDVDVRMLGSGRPFAIEIENPTCNITVESLTSDLSRIVMDHPRLKNAREESLLKVIDVAVIRKCDLDSLNSGEQAERNKNYVAKCIFNIPRCKANDEYLSALWDEVKNCLDSLRSEKTLTDGNERYVLMLNQKTPLRVLQRRPLHTRKRAIYDIRLMGEGGFIPHVEKSGSKTRRFIDVEQFSYYTFDVTLHTQSGTYIKEFIHGDLNRTTPNLNTILRDVLPHHYSTSSSSCLDILSLDVLSVDFEFPPKSQSLVHNDTAI